MILKTLVENTSISRELKSRHGLSFYIETNGRKLLFDLGPNALFLENAEKMGVPIPEIDTVILSHGHMDHGGGLPFFLEKNHTARVYIRENAFQKHFSKNFGFTVPVGIDEALKQHPQIFLTHARAYMDEHMLLFSDVATRDFWSSSNGALYMEKYGRLIPDSFSHEQSLILREGENTILISGCSHCGIVNIKRKAERIIGKPLTHVIGGFHLYNPISRQREKRSLVQQIGSVLQEGNTCYYTCHCTGRSAYSCLKKELGERLHPLSTGSVLEI